MRVSAILAAGISALFLLGAVSPVAVGGATNSPRVSYNPGAAAQYHAPISGMGLVALTHSYAYYMASSGQSSSGASPPPQGTPVGLTRFVNDSSYAPQSETSVAVDPANPQHVLGGFNDGRWFVCASLSAADCPDGYTKSVTGFTTSNDGGATVAKSNDLPGITMPETNASSHVTSPGFLYSWGDPSVAPGPGGSFYFASLAIDPLTGANGIIIEKSTAALFGSSSCQTLMTSPDTNPCWTVHWVYGNLTFQCGVFGCGTTTFEDKETVAVDLDSSSPAYGSVYIAWDHFFADGTSASYLAVCSPTLSCQMLSGGGQAVVSGSDIFAGNATPVVGADGTVYVSWCNFGTLTTYGPVVCGVKSSSSGGASFGSYHSVMSFMGTGTQLAGDTVIVGFATEQFRTSSELTLAAGSAGDLYFAIPVCVSGFYYRFNNLPFLPGDNPGNCGNSAVFFTRSTDGGATWSSPTQASTAAVVIQPTLAYDSKTGAVALAYYTSQFDPFNHRIDVALSVSNDKGQSWSFTRVTPVSNEPNADPTYYAYPPLSPNGEGGSIVVPQYGDYFTAWAQDGRVWVLFTGDYAKVQGTFKASPFLAMVGEVPSSLNLSSNARDAAPGDRVAFAAGGFSAGSTLSLSLRWSGISISLANATVGPDGRARGNFTVPNVQSQVYTLAAEDGTGLTSTASLGVGQVSLGGVQSALANIQSTLTSLQTAISTGFTSVGSSIASARANLSSTISGIGSSVSKLQSQVNSSVGGASSTLSIIEYLVLAAVVLLIVVLVLQATSRKKSPGPAASMAPAPQMGPSDSGAAGSP